MNAYQFPELAMLDGMNETQRRLFLAHAGATRKDEVVGVVLAVLLGHFGVHRFHLGEIGWGLLYLAFCWTGIPTVLGVIEAFFMPRRVREYNLGQAVVLASQIRAMPPSATGMVTA